MQVLIFFSILIEIEMNYDILFVIRNSVSDKKFSKHVIVDWEINPNFHEKKLKEWTFENF